MFAESVGPFPFASGFRSLPFLPIRLLSFRRQPAATDCGAVLKTSAADALLKARALPDGKLV